MWRSRPNHFAMHWPQLQAKVAPLLTVLFLTLVGAAMAGWTWNTWADPVVDFGRDMYVAWRLAEGESLYRDVAYFNGPLTPWINATVLQISGPSLQAVYLANAVVLLGVAGAVYCLFGFLAGPRCGVACVFLFLTLFAFAQYTEQGAVGGYNFLAPYSHEMTYGLLLSLLGLLLLKPWLETEKRAWLASAGVALGLAFLTKPEIFAAAALGAGAAIVFNARRKPRPGLDMAVAGAVLCVSILGVWTVCVAALTASLPWGDAVAHSLGAWRHIANPRIAEMDFYRWVSGFDATRVRLAILGFWLLIQTAVLRLALRWGLRRPMRPGLPLDALLLGTALALAWRCPMAMSYVNAFASLPVWLVATLGIGLAQLWKVEDEPDHRRLVLGLAAATFALALLAKIALNARIYHYGFVLALPAVLTVVACGWVLAREVARRGGSAARFALPLAAFLAITGGLHLIRMEGVLRRHKDQPVANQALRASPQQARVIDATLERIARRIGPTQTLAVWPQGAMINVLARRRNSTPYIVLLPPELEMFGEENILAAYRRSPPDYILLAPCDTRAYGRGEFGDGYARSLRAWLEENYTPVTRRPEDPPQVREEMTLLARRRSPEKGP